MSEKGKLMKTSLHPKSRGTNYVRWFLATGTASHASRTGCRTWIHSMRKGGRISSIRMCLALERELDH